MIAVSLKTGTERSSLHRVGYTEGAIPDVTANRIIDNEMIRNSNRGTESYAWGIGNAVAVLGPLASGEVEGTSRAHRSVPGP